jgi:hypothetical protein
MAILISLLIIASEVIYQAGDVARHHARQTGDRTVGRICFRKRLPDKDLNHRARRDRIPRPDGRSEIWKALLPKATLSITIVEYPIEVDQRKSGRLIMSMRYVMAGEGASTPWIRSDRGSAAGLVVCPMLVMGNGMGADFAEEIYRLAYERAQAALRPSLYEILQRECLN